ncbi:MAG: serine O-acetyltransferase [Burkholderiaceae bacterium]
MAFERLREDIANILDKDPAARSAIEVLLCYPGLHAVLLHRLSHQLWGNGFRTLPRLVSQLGRWLTGIEIHPGAVIGRRVFIDHGMGVVIGETAEVGDDCTIYQGVTLGGTSLEPTKRHPTLEAGVVVSAGAKVLGPFTVGQGARIGSNAVVLKPVPANATAVGIPARVIVRDDPALAADDDAPPAYTPAGALGAFTAYGVTSAANDPLATALHRLIDHVAEQDRTIERLQDALACLGSHIDHDCEKLDAATLSRMVD